MAGRIATIRNLVFQTLDDKKTAGQFEFNDFELKKTYYPFSKLEELGITPDGRVYVIGLAFDTDQPKTRTTAGSRNEIPIQVAFQKVVSDPQDTEEIDKLIEFVEQLDETCRKEVVTEEDEEIPYQWLRNEALKDDNDLPFAFVGLREANVFEAWFNAVYLRILI